MGEYRSPKIVPLSEDKTIKKSHPFLLFAGIWFSFLALALILFLGKFREYLISYESEYQASLPAHYVEKIVGIVQKNDMVSIQALQTEPPEISEFETEQNLYDYMTELIEGKNISFSETEESTDDNPEYYITADQYIIATLKLKKSANQERKYGLPVWEKDTFEFYTDAQHSVRVSCPTCYHVYVNGVEIPTSYSYKNDPYPGEDYFRGTIELPHNRCYLIEDLYREPTVTAKAEDGSSIEPVLDTEKGMYVVPLTVSEDVETEMLDFATKAALNYTHYVQNDAGIGACQNYFLAGTNYLQMVEYGESRKYYPWHRIQSEETEVIEFNPYDNDHFYIQVNINQNLLVRGSEEKDVTTENRFYIMRTNQGFKICGLEY
ncbi:MAG: hypothetical protein IKO32_10280 [Lachnospiraceae bacterium]|nr:hypothetical protein [Lachnospiraceae bacterium]